MFFENMLRHRSPRGGQTGHSPTIIFSKQNIVFNSNFLLRLPVSTRHVDTPRRGPLPPMLGGNPAGQPSDVRAPQTQPSRPITSGHYTYVEHRRRRIHHRLRFQLNCTDLIQTERWRTREKAREDTNTSNTTTILPDSKT